MVSPDAAVEMSREHAAPVRCRAETRRCHQQWDAASGYLQLLEILEIS